MSEVHVYLTKAQASKVARDELEGLYLNMKRHLANIDREGCLIEGNYFSHDVKYEKLGCEELISSIEKLLEYYAG